MTFEKMLRVFGWFSIIGGLLITLVQPWIHLDPHSFIAAYFYLLAFIFIAIGLIGHYLIQYKDFGGYGLFSFLLLSISLYLWIGYHWFQTFVYFDLFKNIPDLSNIVLHSMEYGKHLAIYSMLSGILIFSGLSLWKGILSRWSTALLLLAPFMIWIPYGLIAAHFLGGVSFIWSGITLCKGNAKMIEEKDGEEQNREQHEKMLEANQ
ncbi:hypothetical protein [Bacillus benzoevorans]|uniref:Uncharacterized protein n=1 Tax=Bacillus benzoevorans TaxID=1456 RepID=A0A7X0HNF6_9BACI|nr:hypothetical protein [Bacillus benzoevorans]MBB6443989.1 hypothetical protein [Bacillus benzoevorans]